MLVGLDLIRKVGHAHAKRLRIVVGAMAGTLLRAKRAGEVVIRERPPQLTGQAQAGYGRSAAHRDDDGRVGRPLSHNERGRRPMPSVEDFPIVGQREYWAKAGATSREQPRSAAPQQRKSTLLQKLTGRDRDQRSDPAQISERPAEEPLDLPVFFRRDPGP